MSAKYTPGPWSYRKFAQSDADIAQMEKLGMTPTLALNNDGQAFVMSGPDDDRKRVALVDCQTKFKRGEGWRTECDEREANARLIAAAPDLLGALKKAEHILASHNYETDYARLAIAKAEGTQ